MLRKLTPNIALNFDEVLMVRWDPSLNQLRVLFKSGYTETLDINDILPTAIDKVIDMAAVEEEQKSQELEGRGL